MKGVVFTGDNRLELLDFPDPVPGPREVVLRIDASGVCGSDLHTIARPPVPGGYVSVDPSATAPLIAGHEPVGTVVDRGPGVGDDVAPLGMAAICFHYTGCGTCAYCLAERPQLCRDTIGYGGTAHGGHAEYLVVPASTLVPLPEGVSPEAGACLACGTGTAYGALKRAPRLDGETVLITGLGPVGTSAVMLAAALGANVVAADIDAGRRETAARFGASRVLDPAVDDVVAILADATDGYGVSVAVDTSGSAAGRRTALASTRPEGYLILVGIGAGSWDLAVDRDVIMAPRAILGSRTFSKSELDECARLVADKKIPLDALVTARHPLSEAQRAYDDFRAGGGKPVLVPDATTSED